VHGEFDVVEHINFGNCLSGWNYSTYV